MINVMKKIKWSSGANKDLDRLRFYCEAFFGNRLAKKIIASTMNKIDQLGTFPSIGPLEPLLNHRPEPWRSLVIHRNVKVIYLIRQESVNIAALWDTRREPKSLANYIDHIVQTEPAILNEPSIPYIKTDK